MHKNIILYICILSVAVLVWWVSPFFNTATVSEPVALTFSQTQEWDKQAFAYAEVGAMNRQVTAVILPPPPTHDSAEVRDELRAVRQLASQRTADDEQAILRELHIDGFTYAGKTLAHHRAADAELDNALRADMELLNQSIGYQKLLFDRVRPSFLDTQISLAIPVPEHPAYPSGHSTQAHFFAHHLGMRNPEQYCQYLSDAAQIARNREIAGVHYTSDSEAGRLLAELLFRSLYPEAPIPSQVDCQ